VTARPLLLAGLLGLCLPGATRAQDTTGAIEGAVTDKTASSVAGARIVVRNLQTGFVKQADSAPDGFYRLVLLPVGEYSVEVSAPQFTTLMLEPVVVSVSQSVRVNAQLELRSVTETVTVAGGAQLVDTTTNTLGRVVTGRELIDLPLNGRNFTQLGLLQTGVAPLTAGVATAGGSLPRARPMPSTACGPSRTCISSTGRRT